tara:strand:+ start:687 stop:1457 length:771 start_codon:yes stop_codon:yes gene_type:complete
MPITVLTPQEIRELDEDLLTQQQTAGARFPSITMSPEYQDRVDLEMSGNSDTTADRRIITSRKPEAKTKFNEAENKSGKFAIRMRKELDTLIALEESGFSPLNVRDQSVLLTPFIRQPGFINNMAKSTKFQIYDNAVRNFTMAQLRDVSGAVIGAEEIRTNMPLYMPIFGDGMENIMEKRQRRENVLAAMIASSNGAYERTLESMAKGKKVAEASLADQERLLLEEEAKTDPVLRGKIKDYQEELIRAANLRLKRN